MVNSSHFKHLATKADFDWTVDYKASTYMMKSKPEPASARIKRLLDVLIAYSFNLYHIKGKI